MTSPQGSDTEIMGDSFMAFRLLMSYLEDLAMTIDPSTGRVRQKLESIDAGLTLTNVTTVSIVTTVATLRDMEEIGTKPASGFIFDTMDIVFNTGIRPQII